jgi:hypothetical protein
MEPETLPKRSKREVNAVYSKILYVLVHANFNFVLFVFWRSGACAHPAADSLPLRGCGWLLSYGRPLRLLLPVVVVLVALWGFCPPWGVFLFVVVVGVCCLVLWGFFLPWTVSVPFCGCV